MSFNSRQTMINHKGIYYSKNILINFAHRWNVALRTDRLFCSWHFYLLGFAFFSQLFMILLIIKKVSFFFSVFSSVTNHIFSVWLLSINGKVVYFRRFLPKRSILASREEKNDDSDVRNCREEENKKRKEEEEAQQKSLVEHQLKFRAHSFVFCDMVAWIWWMEINKSSYIRIDISVFMLLKAKATRSFEFIN